MSNPRTLVRVLAPTPGAQVSRTLTVSGSAGLDPSTVGSHQKLGGRPSITITFNGLAPAEGTLSVQPNGLWQLAGATVPDSIPDGSTLVISVAAQAAWIDDRDQGHESHDADPGSAEVSVQLETRPPELTITPDYPADVVTAALPFEVDIHGTTSGAQSGINQVTVSVDQAPETPAVDASPGHDWSIWRAHLSLTADDHRFTVTVGDSHGRSATQSGSISVHQGFEQADPAIVFGKTIYVRELTDFAKQFVQIPGHSGGPDRPMLAGRVPAAVRSDPGPAGLRGGQLAGGPAAGRRRGAPRLADRARPGRHRPAAARDWRTRRCCASWEPPPRSCGWPGLPASRSGRPWPPGWGSISRARGRTGST